MFTQQVGALDAIVRDTTPDRFADILKNLLGQCQADLMHRGPVHIQLDPNMTRPAPFAVVTEEVNPFFAALDIANFTGYIDTETLPNPLIRHAWAAVIRGPVNIRANLFNIFRIGLVVHHGIWCRDLWAENFYDHNGDPYEFAITAQQDGSDKGTEHRLNFVNTGNVDFTVTHDDANDRNNVAASYTDPGSTYYDNGSEIATQPNVNFIDTATVTWQVSEDSPNDEVEVRATAIIPDRREFYCVAQKQWSTAGLVEVVRVSGGSAFNAYFTDDTDYSKVCPNVHRGQTILCTTDDDDRVVVIDPMAYDDPLGTVKFRAKAVPSEWERIGGAQTVTLSDATEGQFTLTFDGQVTANIDYDATTAEVEAALEALSNVGSGNAVVTGASGAWVVNFQTAIGTDHEAMTFTNVSLNVGASGGVSGTFICGWGRQDSIHNATSPYSGSGMDWTTDAGVVQSEAPPYYLAPAMGTPTNAADGGAYDDIAHNHTVVVATGFADIATHGTHNHKFGFHCNTHWFVTDETEPSAVLGYLLTQIEDPHGSAGSAYTGQEKATSLDHDVEHADTSLTHTDGGHGHTATTGTTYQQVHFKTLIPVERVDNSTEALGI